MGRPPPSCGAWTWTHRIAGPIGGASIVGFGLFALMGGWWLVACGPCAVVATAATVTWLRLQRLADTAARLNHETLQRRLRRRDVGKDPPKEDDP